MKTSPKYIFDREAGVKVVNWIEKYCTHVKAEWGGDPLILAEWQKEEIIIPAFGWKIKETGLRRYRRVFVFIPRKNGKSTCGSAIALYLLCADGEPGAEIFSAASDRLQAGIIHDVAKQMTLQNNRLTEELRTFVSTITYPSNGSFYRVLSSDAPRQHGKNAHGIIFDELHTQPNRELWDVLTTSTGSRRQPMTFAFTTAGFDRETICYEQYEYACKVRDGIITDDTFLPVIYESEEKDDVFDEKVWKKANPNYKISLKEEYIREEATRATNTPSYENTFRRLQLNQWTASETRFIPDAVWVRGVKEFDLEKLKGKPCVCGLDLASRRDICAFVQLFPYEDTFIAVAHFWVPGLTARERTKKDGVNYDKWIKEGHITETEGNVTDYDYIRKFINDQNELYDIRTIAYDRWNASQLVINLQDDGFTCTPFGQGFASMSAPTKELEGYIYNAQINHLDNPVLRWMNSNVMTVENAAGDIKIDKSKSTEKVDGMVALVMAVGELMTNFEGETSVYDERGVRSL